MMPWVLDVELAAGTDPRAATNADVTVWRSGENDGLWNGLYLASQAYRYAVTHDAAALTNLQRFLDGEGQRMRITGVPGLFTRQLIAPNVSGISCPSDPAVYVPSADKTSNRWVRIGSDGCAQTADATTMTFSSTTHCGLDEFAGWCFLDNVSQDEYVGHMFALGAIAKLVDDAGVHATAVDLLQKIGTHLVAHNMEFVDWDGRATRFGRIHPGAPTDAPGYLAIMGISFLTVIAESTGDPSVRYQYQLAWAQWQSYFDQILLWQGTDGCLSNWNDISMMVASFHHAIWFETNDARRAMLQNLWDAQVMQAPVSRAAADEKNAWFDLMWAAQKGGVRAYDQVHTALCQLRQFPASNQTTAHDLSGPAACNGRQGEPLSAQPFDTADRCAATYLWWGNPYERRVCADAPTEVQQPAGYLLPYWMGRYYGFVPSD